MDKQDIAEQAYKNGYKAGVEKFTKYQFSPETPDSIAGVPVSDLLFIAKIVGDKPCLIEQIKDVYAFGHAVGYNAGLALFEKKLHEAILRMSSEPIRLERGDDFNFTKVKFEIPPYEQQEVDWDNVRLYGVKISDVPQYIKAVVPSIDGDDNNK